MGNTTKVFIDMSKMAILGVEKHVLYKAMDLKEQHMGQYMEFWYLMNQRRLRQAREFAQSRQSLHCSHT